MADELQTQQPDGDNCVETALKLSGKSEEEARKTGAIDRADEQVEELFAEKYRTEGSPAHKAVWGDSFPLLRNETLTRGVDRAFHPDSTRLFATRSRWATAACPAFAPGVRER